jgi:hypothetical protein
MLFTLSSARQLQDMCHHATTLFRLLFFLPRPVPAKFQNGWPFVAREAKMLVTRSVRDYRSFVTVAARNNPTCNSYPFILFCLADYTAMYTLVQVTEVLHPRLAGWANKLNSER